MIARRTPLFVLAVLMLVAAVPASAIFISDCPQKCTPSCPCSIVCQGPFGPTTCGEAGEACTNYGATGVLLDEEPNMTPAEGRPEAPQVIPELPAAGEVAVPGQG